MKIGPNQEMKSQLIGLVCLCVLALGGCVGDGTGVSQGMSEQDAKSAIDKMKPEDKIRAINSSPMPQAEKDKKFAEIEQETGVKAADVLGNSGKPNVGGN